MLNSGLLDGLENDEILFVTGLDSATSNAARAFYTRMARLFVPPLQQVTGSIQ